MAHKKINSLANQVANALVEMGIKHGDKVGLASPNLPFFPIIYYGILKAGAVVVPLSVLLKKDEIAYHLSDSDAKAYFCFAGTPDLPTGQMGYAGFNEAPDCEHFLNFSKASLVNMGGDILNNQSVDALRRWQKEGDITDIPKYEFGSTLNNLQSPLRKN